MGIDSSVNLLLAGMDLKLVQLLRSAMNHGGPGGATGAACGNPSSQGRQVHQPTPRIEPRKVIHPAAYYTPRPVHHPEPTFAPPTTLPLPDTHPHALKNLFPAPWKQPLKDLPPEPRPIIKQVQYKVEIVHKGSLIDFFI